MIINIAYKRAIVILFYIRPYCELINIMKYMSLIILHLLFKEVLF